MRVLVYDVAASSSGALGVLEDFYDGALLDKENEYVFVVSVPELADSGNVKVLSYPKVKKSWFHRLAFDWFKAPLIVGREAPDRVMSLQNMRIPRVDVRQVVYEHNCIFKPFCDYRFSVIREPALWIRQNILGFFTVRSLKKADELIVQTEWMKNRCVNNLGIDASKIEVRPPALKRVPQKKFEAVEDASRFIYPAAFLSYKNHELILDALKLMPGSLRNRIRVEFTLDQEGCGSLLSRVLKEDLPIELTGWKTRDELYECYSYSALLFTSMLESYPLPLHEARVAGCPIVVPNSEYALEILSDYENAFFYEQNNPEDLTRAIESVVSKW